MSKITRRGDGVQVTVAVVDAEIVVRGIETMLAPFGDIDVVPPEPTRSVDLLLVDADVLNGSVPPGPSWRGAAEALARGHVRRLVALSWQQGDRAETTAPAISKRCGAAELRTRLRELATQDPAERAANDAAVMRAAETIAAPHLPRREQEVLVMIAQGATTDEIARHLNLSTNTVKTYTRRLFRRIGVPNRTRAALVAHRMGLVDLSSPGGVPATCP